MSFTDFDKLTEEQIIKMLASPWNKLPRCEDMERPSVWDRKAVKKYKGLVDEFKKKLAAELKKRRDSDDNFEIIFPDKKYP